MTLVDSTKAQRMPLRDAAAISLREAILSYTRVDTAELRASLDRLLELLIDSLTSDGPVPVAALHDVGRRRLEPGFSSSDMLRAALLVGPTIRAVLGQDRFSPDEHRRLDDLLRELALTACAYIGINTCDAVLGNVGSERRLELTVLGDAIHVADRLQSLARNAELLVGPGTARAIQGVAHLRLVCRGDHQLEGRSEPVPVCEIQT